MSPMCGVVEAFKKYCAKLRGTSYLVISVTKGSWEFLFNLLAIQLILLFFHDMPCLSNEVMFFKILFSFWLRVLFLNCSPKYDVDLGLSKLLLRHILSEIDAPASLINATAESLSLRFAIRRISFELTLLNGFLFNKFKKHKTPAVSSELSFRKSKNSDRYLGRLLSEICLASAVYSE